MENQASMPLKNSLCVEFVFIPNNYCRIIPFRLSFHF
ncbi:Uncharacterised protein [Serratia quinivorans]|nr:Uncharacterised protein [Serratia quinivorans]CAI1229338.1 Uncharacterised protein [Serratia quinivorans]CAI1965670.1 Uncharacterised protein [Serratia quinivorans]CAI2021646.1 Uncharacterised protein [Serratia quinivorans]CAI2155254.1 Uncharacterised protein [Serratia quinivorans]